jgi:alkylation response protein AidB-like acyl-CoA dehydrogenase
MFMLDTKAPGIEIRPIHQMSGEREFNEVFLNDVRIPDSHRLEPECGGWKVMLSTLFHERLSVGGSLPTNLHASLTGLERASLRDGKPALEDPRVKARIADAYLSQKGVDLIISCGLTALSKGKEPGPAPRARGRDPPGAACCGLRRVRPSRWSSTACASRGPARAASLWSWACRIRAGAKRSWP